MYILKDGNGNVLLENPNLIVLLLTKLEGAAYTPFELWAYNHGCAYFNIYCNETLFMRFKGQIWDKEIVKVCFTFLNACNGMQALQRTISKTQDENERKMIIDIAKKCYSNDTELVDNNGNSLLDFFNSTMTEEQKVNLDLVDGHALKVTITATGGANINGVNYQTREVSEAEAHEILRGMHSNIYPDTLFTKEI